MNLVLLVLVAVFGTLLLPLRTTAGAGYTRIERLLRLEPDEGVFAYARVSGDGMHLSYASERRVDEQITRTVNFIDLRTRKVLHSEPGLDAYWAPDGRRVVFMSTKNSPLGEVALFDLPTKTVTRNIAPAGLGAYFSWAQVGGKDVILTQNSHYYVLRNGKAERPYRDVRPCPGIGTGEQPMISRDGRMIATFVKGTLVVRPLESCDPILETNLAGGKADFSWDGRYIAFHAPKGTGQKGFRIVVVDLEQRRLIPVTDLPGSSFYPSWSKDGRLFFRYDSDDFRGFVIAHDFLRNAPMPLPATPPAAAEVPTLTGLFRSAVPPSRRVVLVNVWAAWCVHCRDELPHLEQLGRKLRARSADAEIVLACEPSSFDSDRSSIIERERLTLPQVELDPADVERFGVLMFPTSLLFVDGRLADRRYGAQSLEGMESWLGAHGVRLN